VVWMDAPILEDLNITVFHHQDVFDTPQLSRFICRAQGLNTHDEAHLKFDLMGASVTVPQTPGGALDLEITSRELYDFENYSSDQFTSLVQAFNSSFPLIP
jgi:hypothetical protein